MPRYALFASIAVLAIASTPAAASQATPQDPVEDLLRARGEAYHRASDEEQDPAEVRTTQALNAEIAAQNELAESQERSDRDAFEAANAAREAEIAAAEAAAASERAAYEVVLRASDEARAQHERDMADWRATVAACERGDRARCEAGHRRARSQPY